MISICSGGEYSFKVVPDGDGKVKVITGSVNNITLDEYPVVGTPQELWLEATLNVDAVVTTLAVKTSATTDSTTKTSRQLAAISWSGGTPNVPTIYQGLKGSQNLLSCGLYHGWSSLYDGESSLYL